MNKKQNLAQQRGNTMSRKKLSRRQFVAATALSSAALITAPYIRGAHAAGKLTIGFWDHWVPGANKASTDLVNEWAETFSRCIRRARNRRPTTGRWIRS